MKSKAFSISILGLLSLCLSAAAQLVTVQHSFSGSPDGADPNRVYPANGLLFGSTAAGGTTGNGMLFMVNPNSGAFTPIYNFNDANYSAVSPNDIVVAGGLIFGTTQYGGANTNTGYIYSIGTNGSGFTKLYSFGPPPDGANPICGLTLGGATLYGTTHIGGAGSTNPASGFTDGGTVFKINTNGTGYAILHSFTNTPDGAQPKSELVLAGSTLYGITTAGGAYGNGTIYSINTNGSGYTRLYSFTNTPDAVRPYGSLVLNGATLYGMGSAGGTNNTGAIFALSTNGSGYRIIYSFSGFAGNADGTIPQSMLTASGAFLYGTATSGGTGNGGTVFLINANGTGFAVIGNFTNGGATGSDPISGAIRVGNAVWGTANLGGTGGGGTLYKVPMPAITQQPQTLSASNTASVTFTVNAADDSPITYQWYFNGGLLAGQTSQTLTLPSVTTNNNGAYTVVVADSFGSVTSQPAILTVALAGTPPVITSQPQDFAAPSGATATFTVAASGTAPLSYQWYFNTNTPVSGGAAATLTLPAVTPGQAGYYTVVVSNLAGSVTSSPAQLTVNASVSPPVITQQPTSITVTNGYTANFTNVATSTGPLFYQWYFNTNTAVPNATNPILSVPFVATNQAGYYSVIVTNAAGRATSTPARLTVISTAPIIIVQPQPISTATGSVVTFSVIVGGQNPIHYQWYTNSVVAAFAQRGATNSSLTFTATAKSAGNYLVVVTNKLGKVTSSAAALSIVNRPIITLDPVPVTVTNGDAFAMSSAATGPGTLTYQWLFQTNTLVPGATNITLAFTNAYSSLRGYYAMRATNSFGAVTSSYALLTVKTQLVFRSFNFDRADGSPSFAIANAVGSTNRLWGSTNLAAPWFPVASNVMAANGLWFYTDTNSAQTNRVRLYRFSTP